MPFYIWIKTSKGHQYNVRVPDKYLTEDKKQLKKGMRIEGSKYQKWKAKATKILETYGDRNDPELWWNSLHSKQRKTLLDRYHTKKIAIQNYLHISKLK